MWLDAALAYLHYAAIFTLFAFLTVQAMVLRAPLDQRLVRLLGRSDIWVAGAAGATLVTGFLRAGLGAKGGDFYFGSWPIYVKIAMFAVVGLMSIKPTLAYIRWRKAYEQDPTWSVPAGEHAAMRKRVMAEVHIAALIPVVAVIMARGLGALQA
jgi:putative membrane protein